MSAPAPRLITRHALANGLPVVTLRLPHLHVGYVMLLVRNGPRFEAPDQHGLSHFCEHMVFRGAGRFESSAALARALEDAGGQLDAATYRDCTIFTTPYIPGRLPRAMQVLAAVVQAPAFRSLEVERRIILEELNELEDEEGGEIDIENLSRALMFEGHPLGQRIDGTRARIEGFGRRHLIAHHRRCYAARNMVLVIAGPERPRDVERCARRLLTAVPSGQRLPLGPPPGPLRRAPRLRFISQEGSQTEVRFGFRTPGERDERAAALLLARRLLDDGASSRLQGELVERRGLAYELWADLDLAPDVGVLDLGATVAHPKVVATVRAMLGCVARLAREAPSLEELRRAKRRAVWSFQAAIDSPITLGEWVGRGVLFDLNYDISRSVAQIRSLRRAQVRDALRAIFNPATLGLVAVGKITRRDRRALRALLGRQRRMGVSPGTA